MRLLLDAHTLVWAAESPSKLGSRATTEIKKQTNERFVGAGTVWELAIKVGLGKLSLSLPFADWMNKAIADLAATILPISIEHAAKQTELAGRGDPFDRLLAAQSLVETMTIVSNDADLDQYGVQRLW